MSGSRVHDLASEMSGVRADFERLFAELQQRRREATDVKLQARRHPRAVRVLAAVLAAGLVLLVRGRLRRRRELRDPRARRRRMRAAFARMAEDPKRVRVDGQGMFRSMATSAGTAFLTSLARRAAMEASLPRARGAAGAPSR